MFSETIKGFLMNQAIQFPKDFLWGTATAAYQIEGAAAKDGRGPSIWDTFSHTPGKTLNGDTGDVACDHYHRFRDDIALMKDLGISTYRFSASWSRILPAGRGQINEVGLDFYKELVDELLKAGITPYCTLYHWDLPQALHDQGGWLNRETSAAFAEYAGIISATLGDRIKHWMTFNEPLCIAYVSHAWGEHAPGHRDLSYREANRVIHHVYLAHGLAIPILRANSQDCQVGIVLNLAPAHPASDSDADKAAAQRVDAQLNRWFADPIFKGTYPDDRLAMLADFAKPPIQPSDMSIISTPIDFLGINYYFRVVVVDDSQAADPTIKARFIKPEGEYTAMDWEVHPDGLRELIVRFHREYGPKAIYVTENGCAYPDTVDAEGQVIDPKRVAYLQGHFRAAGQALAEGAPLKGYFVWSMMDNFEWAYGYDRRFGLVHIDYASQKRTPKESFRFYQKVIAENEA
jgi:beta-glucosidase